MILCCTPRNIISWSLKPVILRFSLTGGTEVFCDMDMEGGGWTLGGRAAVFGVPTLGLGLDFVSKKE